MIPFDEAGVRRAVATFRRTRGVDDTPATVVARLDRAVEIAVLKGPDTRWRTVPFWVADDDPGDPGEPGEPFGDQSAEYRFANATTDIAQTVADRVLEIEDGRRGRGGGPSIDTGAFLSVSRWARFSLALRDARACGLGWLVPVHRELLMVPMPVVRTAAGRPNVLHDDTGRPAIEWMDGTVGYYLHGVEVDKRTYTRITTADHVGAEPEG